MNNDDGLHLNLFDIKEDKEFDYNKWSKEMIIKYEEKQKQENIIPDSPDQKTQYLIDKMFKEFDDNLQKKIIKFKLTMHEEIYGPCGASKKLEFNSERSNIKFNKVMNDFEELIQTETNKLKIKRNEINDYLNSLDIN